jgi:Xaa-Pro dipeptidase
VTPLDRLREWLDREHIAEACITDPVSIDYLTGFSADTAERLMALAVGADAAVLVVPALELENAESRVREIEVVGWRDGQDPWQALASALGSHSRIAVEKGHLTLAAAERLQGYTGSAEFAEVGEAIRRLRLVKTPLEVGALTRAAAATDRLTARLLETLAGGQTEVEVATTLARLTAEEGASASFPALVQSGRTRLSHT